MLRSKLLLLQVSGQKTADVSSSFVTLVTTILQSSNPKAVICIYVQLVFVPIQPTAVNSSATGLQESAE